MGWTVPLFIYLIISLPDIAPDWYQAELHGGVSYLALLDLGADDLPPLLDDLDEEVTLLQQLALLPRRVHLGGERDPSQCTNMWPTSAAWMDMRSHTQVDVHTHPLSHTN